MAEQTQSQSSGRVSYRTVLAQLRRQIVGGDLAPGARLPTRRELNRQFGASPLTVQRAFERLRAEGFIEARGRAGTFVTAQPPHLSTYALVLQTPGSSDGRFDEALAQQAQNLSHDHPVRMRVFQQVDPQAMTASYRQLLNDLQQDRLAGVIFAGTPTPLLKMAMRNVLTQPAVIIAPDCSGDIPAVCTDEQDLLNRSFAEAAQRSRRRVAVLLHREFPPQDEAKVLQLAEEHHVVVRPQWLVPACCGQPATTAAIVRLLMQCPRRNRPNALVLTHEHLLEQAIAGLDAEELRVGRDVHLLTRVPLPRLHDGEPTRGVQYVGFDTRRMLAACLDILERIKRGETVPQRTFLPAELASEVNQRPFGPAEATPDGDGDGQLR